MSPAQAGAVLARLEQQRAQGNARFAQLLAGCGQPPPPTTTTVPSSTTSTTAAPAPTTTTSAPTSPLCSQLAAQQAAFNATIDQAEAAARQLLGPAQAAAVIARLEQQRAQGNAQFAEQQAACRVAT
nr:hypothetical protein [uncultured bacterium]